MAICIDTVLIIIDNTIITVIIIIIIIIIIIVIIILNPMWWSVILTYVGWWSRQIPGQFSSLKAERERDRRNERKKAIKRDGKSMR